MKTFFLLIVVVCMTIQVQAKRNEEELLTQEEAMAENQFRELPSMEAKDSDIRASDAQQRKLIVCYCKHRCSLWQTVFGSCQIKGVYYQLCCK